MVTIALLQPHPSALRKTLKACSERLTYGNLYTLNTMLRAECMEAVYSQVPVQGLWSALQKALVANRRVHRDSTLCACACAGSSPYSPTVAARLCQW